MFYSFIKRYKLWLTAFVATIAFVLIHIHLYNPHELQGSDSLENLAGAYNVAKYNTYAIWSADQIPHATASREPLYPFLLGMVIKAQNLFANKENDIQTKPIESIYSLTIQPLETMNTLKIVNLVILYAAILLACAFIYWLTRSYLLLLYTASTLIFSAGLAQASQSFLTEPMAALLCTLVSILLFYSKKLMYRRSYCILLGCSLAALILTKALYLYFLPFVFIYLRAAHLQALKMRDKTILRNFGIFTFCLVISVGSWMTRNYVDFHRFFIADRKAEVLMYRAQYDSISLKEYPYTFAVWGPGLGKHFLRKETEQNWTRLHNRLGNDEIIIGTYHNVFEPFLKDKVLQPNGRYKQADLKKLEKLSIHRILNHKIGHIGMTLAFLYRSYFVEDGAGLRYLGINLPYEANAERRVDNFALAFLVNLPLWFGFFYLLITSIRRKDYADFGLWMLPSFTVLAYSGLAFSHYRYMQPLIPLLTIIFCLVVKRIFESSKLKTQ